ncbi:MAG: hypothetical protein H7Z16_01100 [Pyrinomonadaceae bacterium]|nr:hypothetical protein [Pyrinomonadaceae bacterium]
MNASPDTIEFRRNVVKPIEFLKAGHELVRSQYWLFVGIAAVGMIIAGVVPMGILMGPMMCGVYLTLFKQRRGQRIEFGDLFKGFDYFGESLIAALLHIVPIFVIIVPTYIIFYISMFGMMAAGGSDPGIVLGFFGFWVIVWIVLIAIMILLSMIFTFAYPLIVDRRLSGFDAVRLSMKAALANFWGLLGMMLLSSLLSFAGVLLCYVGAFLVMPITFGAVAVAYEQVFGLSEGAGPDLPPPPPSFV